jgi:acetolactate synthase-1/2/3 large subunit
MKASDLLVKCLEEENIEYIFGVPGEENADFMMSLEQSEKIKFILTRHEQGAAFMAEIYGRLTGNPAGCLGTLGPGATNLITGVADSNMDRAPMLVLTGQGSTDRLHKESHQIMDVVSMFEPVTKWATTILNPDTIPEIVRKAVRIARTEKPGAVHIELPEDIASEETNEKPMTPRRFRRSVPDDKIVDRAFAMLEKARRPVILAGNGCIRKRASKQLRILCEQTGIGVISTFMAKGCVDMDADYCLYTIGLGSKDRVSLAIDDADLVIALGFDMVEYHPQLWNQKGDKKIIHADFLAAEIDAHYHPEVELIGDLAHTLWMLNERAAASDGLQFDFDEQKKTRQAMADDFAEYKDDRTDGSIRPQKALWDVREVMGPHDIVLSDVGAHKMWIARHYQCHEPNTCLIPNGFCSMGFALPGAIAAGIVHPDRRILAICGDAGFHERTGDGDSQEDRQQHRRARLGR